MEGILTWRGFGCDQEDSWSRVEQAIALWCCETLKARKGDYRTIFGFGSLRLRISLLEMNKLLIQSLAFFTPFFINHFPVNSKS